MKARPDAIRRLLRTAADECVWRSRDCDGGWGGFEEPPRFRWARRPWQRLHLLRAGPSQLAASGAWANYRRRAAILGLTGAGPRLYIPALPLRELPRRRH